MVTWNQTKHLPYWLELSHAKYFPLHLSEPISRRIGWIQFPMFCFPAVLVGTNFPPSAVCVELFCATYFPLYWLEPITRRIGWNQFPVVLLFPLYWLEPISRRIDWNQCPAVLVGTVSRKIFFSVLVEINFPPYWLEPIPCRSVFLAVFV
jgi:hypothetical protein